ncbi:FAD/NAD(P)-binding domain-containing protein [Clathrospora elynae]|uniref:FAD/NAD(P)-binding domain-containing protein n=1 Tax=Clathrospora elynae TaxID=706981 RepID=A0A6A5SKA6_9PLEO|nr:FAD/NAD(P)-binding domain-containing protein [Clathrospora elynae]
MGIKGKVKVILMGVGASSAFFKKAEQEMENLEIVCYEKNSDVGGIWLENQYPGCAGDISSIWDYLKSIERDNNFIAKYIRLRHRLEHVEWDGAAGLWRCRIRDLEKDASFEDSAEFFVNAGGVLNNWKWPDTPVLADFKGKLMHSASYDVGRDLYNKRVAVIGAGSSGMQIVAAIQQKVQHLYQWTRSPIWITTGYAQKWARNNGANFRYSEEQLKFLDENPKKYLEYRKHIENELNQRFKFIIKASEEARVACDSAESGMRKWLHNHPHLAHTMIPTNFNPGCRRPTPAPGYFEALDAAHTTIFTGLIGSITPTGFTDHQGNQHGVDVIICATGFNTSWLPRIPFIAHGTNLRHLWGTGKGVTSYLSVGVPNFPNTFSFYGPYGPLGHGSFLPLAVTKCQVEGNKSLAPKLAPARHFRQYADLYLQRTAWTSPCRSVMDAPRYEDYEIEYLGENMFEFMGNGFEVREVDGRDITNYLEKLYEEGQDLAESGFGWVVSLMETRRL